MKSRDKDCNIYSGISGRGRRVVRVAERKEVLLSVGGCGALNTGKFRISIRVQLCGFRVAGASRSCCLFSLQIYTLMAISKRFARNRLKLSPVQQDACVVYASKVFKPVGLACRCHHLIGA